MMPRHFTEEIETGDDPPPLLLHRFNDASAFHRGNPVSARSRLTPPCGFNDASAFHRGNPPPVAIPRDPDSGLQ